MLEEDGCGHELVADTNQATRASTKTYQIETTTMANTDWKWWKDPSPIGVWGLGGSIIKTWKNHLATK